MEEPLSLLATGFFPALRSVPITGAFTLGIIRLSWENMDKLPKLILGPLPTDPWISISWTKLWRFFPRWIRGGYHAAPCPSPPLLSPGEQAGHLPADRRSVWCFQRQRLTHRQLPVRGKPHRKTCLGLVETIKDPRRGPPPDGEAHRKGQGFRPHLGGHLNTSFHDNEWTPLERSPAGRPAGWSICASMASAGSCRPGPKQRPSSAAELYSSPAWQRLPWGLSRCTKRSGRP